MATEKDSKIKKDTKETKGTKETKDTKNTKNPIRNTIPKGTGGNYQIWLSGLLIALILGAWYLNQSTTIKTYEQDFDKMARAGDIESVKLITNKNIVELTLTEEALKKEKYSNELKQKNPFGAIVEKPPHYFLNITSGESFKEDFDKLQADLPADKRIKYDVGQEADFSGVLFTWGFLILILVAFWFLMRRMTGGGAGGQIFNIGKAKVSMFDSESKVKTTFEDVAGLDEAKLEVEEVVDFLRNPNKYTELGGKIPKGVLLVGLPVLVKHYSQKLLLEKLAFRFSHFQVLIL